MISAGKVPYNNVTVHPLLSPRLTFCPLWVWVVGQAPSTGPTQWCQAVLEIRPDNEGVVETQHRQTHHLKQRRGSNQTQKLCVKESSKFS